jgi:hypothetical protein
MADRTDLEAAATAGVISAEQVQPLHDFLSARKTGAVPAAPVSGEEDLRFIRNFHDVFLAIGIVLFGAGLAVAIGTYVSDAAASPQQGTVLAGALTAGAAAIMWLLGEVFARRRRLFLPAIAIVLTLTLFAVIAAALLYAGVLIGRGFEGGFDVTTMPPELRNGILLAAGVGALAPLAFYLRFRLPFSIGLTGAGAAGFIVIACLITNAELTVRVLPALFLALGLLLFFAGVAFDARDPARASRFSDNGFWLHVAAAPLILRGALGLVEQAFGGDMAAGSPSTALVFGAGQSGSASVAVQAGVTLAVIAMLGVVSLLINRRALIVSALITAGVAIGVLLNAVGLGAGALAAATLITLGVFVLILGAGWHVARRALLAWVRPNGLWARVFPPETPVTA